MRYLAIDLGLKRTGFAICDASEEFCSPMAVFQGRKDLIAKIVGIIKAEDVEAIVLGLPLNMDDSEGGQAKLTYKFAETLKTQINIPIHFQDERLTSFAAKEKIEAYEFTTGKKKKRLDAIAAAEILQAFLDKKHEDDELSE